MNQQIIIKIQLPKLFTEDDQVELKLLGYVFDPILRLNEAKEKQRHYQKSNVGEILKIVVEEYQRCTKYYDNTDWKNIQREMVPVVF